MRIRGSRKGLAKTDCASPRDHTASAERFVPNVDTGCRVLTGSAVVYRMSCVFVLVRLAV